MARLRRVSCSGPGLTRKRRGKGFAYYGPDGRVVADTAVVERVKALAIPPAWTDVWICQAANGHLQAVGTDAAGRRQYLYHPQWRADRDRAKHERVLDMGRRLPAARAQVAADLGDPDEVTALARRDPRAALTRERVLACAFRLLDLGFFRVGGEEYAEEHGSFGLSTLRREHLRVGRDGGLTFSYTGKHGAHRELTLADPQAFAVVSALARRRRAEEQLLVWADPEPGPQVVWRDVASSHINAYVGERLGDATAKDFRTWHATVLAAVALAVSEPTLTSPTARKRAVTRAMREVSDYLGNTPAVARASYVDPRVVDLFHDGHTVSDALTMIGEPGRGAEGAGGSTSAPGTHGAVEEAVLALLSPETGAGATAATG
ncbi:MAG: DNA topoisomerase IB [Kineosporiaceae bacterium]